MTLTIPYRGIIEIVGDHDVGKTIAALQTNTQMKKVVFVDDDVKGEGTVRQMKNADIEFDGYYDLSQERMKLKGAASPDELLQYVVMPTIEKITERHHEVIIWDTWRIVYQSARGHVERNQSKYSGVVNFRGNSQIIQGLISKVARMIEADLLNRLKAACDLLIITHHIKDNYIQNVMVGKIPESSATFSEVCNMRLWLRRNSQSKVPVILFLKRPNIPRMTKSGLKFVNIVPLKITPTDKHESIWEAIAEYEAKPIESRAPRQDETPTPEELTAISGVLTPEMLSYVKASIEYNKLIEKELQQIDTVEETTEPTRKGQVEQKESIDTTPSGLPVNAVQMISRAKAELEMEPMQVVEALGKKSINDLMSTFNPIDWEILVEAQNKKEAAKKKKK